MNKPTLSAQSLVDFIEMTKYGYGLHAPRYVHRRGTYHGRTVAVTVMYVGALMWVAYCSPNDQFSRRTGRLVCARKASNPDVPPLFAWSNDPLTSPMERILRGDDPAAPSWVSKADWSQREE